MTKIQKAEAVMDGLTGDRTLARPFMFGPFELWTAETLHLSAAKVDALIAITNARSSQGKDAELIGLSRRHRCCNLPRVVLQTFYEPRYQAFTRRVAGTYNVCSACGEFE